LAIVFKRKEARLRCSGPVNSRPANCDSFFALYGRKTLAREKNQQSAFK
jgi:hypothetical protein